ncbi:MAG TPA: quinol:electron acceptor oxidoreductase subunit ActD [Polyangiaceae bacterium]|jgi:mono/diheme cytochrome c family protein|nr:quinol:electron acceptor oxidoreductase subunit ActD [Polyangiaceae bacterium]
MPTVTAGMATKLTAITTDSSGTTMSHDHDSQPKTSPADAPLHGLLAEYESPWALVDASKKVRDAGFSRWDTYAPFPIHGIDGAMGIKMTVLPWIVLCAGLTGLCGAILLQWWTNAHDYPWITSGKPFWSIPANVPIMFEGTVLFSAITTLVGMLMLNGLPAPSHPLDLKERFLRATNDRFFLLIQASDPKFDEKRTRALLESTKPYLVDDVKEDRVTSPVLPKVVVYGMITLTAAAAIPFALAAKARFSKSRDTRIHAIGDMDWQPKYKAQRENPFFADLRATRDYVAGTVAVGDLRDDDHFDHGKVAGTFARTFPSQVPTTEATIERGQQRFGIYCTPCHGFAGEGNGMVAQRAEYLQSSGTGKGMAWVPPTNINQEYLRLQPVGQLFDSITNGVRNMPAYGPQIPTEDRWAIVMYLRALQRRGAAH